MGKSLLNMFQKNTAMNAAPTIRRIVDVTTPNKPVPNDARLEMRYNRTLPAIICPSHRGTPDLDSLVIAISQDFSDRGMSAITFEPLEGEEFFFTVWPFDDSFSEPAHFRCSKRASVAIAQRIWSNRFRVEELMNRENRRVVDKLTAVAVKVLRVSE